MSGFNASRGSISVEDWYGGTKENIFEDSDLEALLADVVYYELLKPSETITGDLYRTQLMRLSRALKEKRPQLQERHDKVILQHDNARLHIA